VFDHLINGKENRRKYNLKNIWNIRSEKDRNAKLVIRMEEKSTFITDPKLTCKLN
jgi:hypothetical protein